MGVAASCCGDIFQQEHLTGWAGRAGAGRIRASRARTGRIWVGRAESDEAGTSRVKTSKVKTTGKTEDYARGTLSMAHLATVFWTGWFVAVLGA